MNTMGAALLKANLVTEADMKMATKRADAEAEEQGLIKAIVQRMETAVDALPSTIGSEVTKWMEDNNKLIPMEVLEKWAEIAKADKIANHKDASLDTYSRQRGENPNITREWAKWLNAMREIKVGA